MSAAAEAPPRTVIVTGGADGIGLAIASCFLADGFAVHVCDVRPEAVAALRASHPAIGGTVADVGEPDGVTRLFDDARGAMGPIGVLVNNVGIGGPRAPIEAIAAEDWDRSFRVNVLGTLLCMQAVVPEMKARRSGAIINVSTASTRTRLPLRTAYVASKFAVEGLTLNAARELGPWNIRCNAIQPGIMNNARMDQIIATRSREEGRTPAELEEEYLRAVSLRTRTEPEDVGAAALFLASPGGARITGELLSVSGNLEWEQ